MPVVTLVQFGDAIAAGAFFQLWRPVLTDIHRKPVTDVTEMLPIGLQILCLVGIHLVNGCARAERKNDARPRVAMINLVFIVFTPGIGLLNGEKG
jgi:hypothetical protein